VNKTIKISSIYELQKIGNDPAYPLDGEYELTQDIDASKTIVWNNGFGFEPIGKVKNQTSNEISSGYKITVLFGLEPIADCKPFTGKFDGKGYKIIGLSMHRFYNNYIGLFSMIDFDAEVKNVILEKVSVRGKYCTGSIAGENRGSITNCYSTGEVLGIDFVGGLIGNNIGILDKCYSKCMVLGYDYIGGLIGRNYYGIVSDCYSKGRIDGQDYVGGFVGYNEYGSIIKCKSFSKATGRFYKGDFIGENKGMINFYIDNRIIGFCSKLNKNRNESHKV